jgi:hypothetical protein
MMPPRTPVEKIAAMTTAEIILDAYNTSLQALNATLALTNESMHDSCFRTFNELAEAMKHLGHAYSVMLANVGEGSLDEKS